MKLIQYTENFANEQEARVAFDFMAMQVCYKGGRVLPPVNQIGKNCWRIQTFHDATGVDGPLPDGCRLIIMLESMRCSLMKN